MESQDHEIVIKDCTALGSGLYRFFGTYPKGGFYADTRLKYCEVWRATLQGTNYQGDLERLTGIIAHYAETM